MLEVRLFRLLILTINIFELNKRICIITMVNISDKMSIDIRGVIADEYNGIVR